MGTLEQLGESSFEILFYKACSNDHENNWFFHSMCIIKLYNSGNEEEKSKVLKKLLMKINDNPELSSYLATLFLQNLYILGLKTHRNFQAYNNLLRNIFLMSQECKKEIYIRKIPLFDDSYFNFIQEEINQGLKTNERIRVENALTFLVDIIKIRKHGKALITFFNIISDKKTFTEISSFLDIVKFANEFLNINEIEKKFKEKLIEILSTQISANHLIMNLIIPLVKINLIFIHFVIDYSEFINSSYKDKNLEKNNFISFHKKGETKEKFEENFLNIKELKKTVKEKILTYRKFLVEENFSQLKNDNENEKNKIISENEFIEEKLKDMKKLNKEENEKIKINEFMNLIYKLKDSENVFLVLYWATDKFRLLFNSTLMNFLESLESKETNFCLSLYKLNSLDYKSKLKAVKEVFKLNEIVRKYILKTYFVQSKMFDLKNETNFLENVNNNEINKNKLTKKLNSSEIINTKSSENKEKNFIVNKNIFKKSDFILETIKLEKSVSLFKNFILIDKGSFEIQDYAEAFLSMLKEKVFPNNFLKILILVIKKYPKECGFVEDFLVEIVVSKFWIGFKENIVFRDYISVCNLVGFSSFPSIDELSDQLRDKILSDRDFVHRKAYFKYLDS